MDETQKIADEQFLKVTPVVVYPTTRALLNGKPGALAWTKDNQIVLQVTGSDSPLFTCKPEDIVKFRYMIDQTIIKLRDGRKFMIGINLKYTQKLYGGLTSSIAGQGAGALSGVKALGVIGDIYFMKNMAELAISESRNDSKWWIESLKMHGVTTKHYSGPKLFVMTIVGAFVLVVIVALIVA